RNILAKIGFAAGERNSQKVWQSPGDFFNLFEAQLLLWLVQLFPVKTVAAKKVASRSHKEDQTDRKTILTDDPAGDLCIPDPTARHGAIVAQRPQRFFTLRFQKFV